MYENFKNVFPAQKKLRMESAIDKIGNFCRQEFNVEFPADLAEALKHVGAGYFGKRDIYIFYEDGNPMPRDSFVEWNLKDFWRSIFPLPSDGGPIFFAETCFGDQLGFRMEKGQILYVLFLVDTFEMLVIAKSADEFFGNLMTERYALVDRDRLIAVEKKLGELKTGMHFAPIVSPLLGGKGNVENFCMETPNVHLRTACATFLAAAQQRI